MTEGQTKLSPIEKGRQFVEKKYTTVFTTKKGIKKKKIVGLNINHIRRFLADLWTLKNQLLVETNGHTLNLEQEIAKMRVKLVYQAGKFSDLRRLQEFLDREMMNIGSCKKNLEDFLLLVESIVAYHRFYGGKES